MLLDTASKEKITLLLLILCFIAWVSSVSGVSFKLDPTGTGPFQFLPPYFWLAFSVIILIVIYTIVTHAKFYLLFISMVITGLFTLGTFTIIMPQGMASTDSYAITSVGKFVFDNGTLKFGHPYPPNYPTSFIFHGALLKITGVSVKDMIRFYPLLVMVSYLCGITVLLSTLCKRFNLTNRETMSITGMSFFSLVIFIFSLGLRMDPVPQAFSLMLLPFLLSPLPVKFSAPWRLMFMIFLLAMVSTHMMTSFLSVLSIWVFILFMDRKPALYNLLLPLVGWLSWVSYMAIYNLRTARYIIFQTAQLELEVEKITTKVTGIGGLGIPGVEAYLHLRTATLILMATLIIVSFLFLILRKRNIALLLVFLGASISPLLYFWFSKDIIFVMRVIEISSIYLTLILGFGLYEALKDWKSPKVARKFPLKPLLSLSVTVLIFITSIFSVITARHSELIFGPTNSLIKGNEFLVSRSKGAIFTFRPITMDYPEFQIAIREAGGNRADFEDSKQTVSGIVGISAQWRYGQQIRDRMEITGLELFREWLNEADTAKKVYDSGPYETYISLPKS